MCSKNMDIKGKILDAKTEREIVQASERYGGVIESYIKHLHDLVEMDGDEYSVSLESLKTFALFLCVQKNLTHSQVGLAPDIHIDAVYDTPDRNITLLLEFLPSHRISYTVMKHMEDNEKPQFANGETDPDNIIKTVKTVCPQIKP